MWTKSDVKKELEKILDRLEDVQMNYDVYSDKADKLISDAMDKIDYAIEVL